MELIAWGILIGTCLLGFLGIFLPLLPGLPLIGLGVLLHKWLLPDFLSWWVIGITLAAIGLGLVLDWGITVISVRKAGATRWGIFGACLGTLLGILSGGWGILFGPVLGAVVAEIFLARKTIGGAMQSGVGAGAGVVLSGLSRFFLTLGILGLIGIHSCIRITVLDGTEPKSPPSLFPTSVPSESETQSGYGKYSPTSGQ